MGSSTRQKTEKNPRRAISTTRILRSGYRIDDRPAPIAMGRAEPIGTTSGKPEWYPARPKKRDLAVSAYRPLTMGSSTRQKTVKNPRRAISTTRILRSGYRIDDRPAPMAMGRAEPIRTTSGKPEWYPACPKKRGATRGLSRMSPILVLLSPKHG